MTFYKITEIVVFGIPTEVGYIHSEKSEPIHVSEVISDKFLKKVPNKNLGQFHLFRVQSHW